MSHKKTYECIKPDGDGCDGDHFLEDIVKQWLSPFLQKEAFYETKTMIITALQTERDKAQQLEADCAAMRKCLCSIEYHCETGHLENSGVRGLYDSQIKNNVVEMARACLQSNAGTKLLERMKALEDVADAAKELMNNYEKCPQYPENITIRPLFLNVLRKELQALDELEKKKT